ncbi:dihydrodipicolinate synthase family protein [Halalkalibacterium ligniniphilum]|uniref:dihydrodipicolinate synthase family protein n=1 Tax=Halalkalibacterium ligniniphilum TaxID=1134413 RepID=UPI000349A92D|nr:dihydrodipicolinate synthase family protein [Halalkalibacterium ligniniphilum]
MSNQPQFRGIIPPVSTLLKESGEIDREGMKLLIDHLIDAGVHGLFFLGTGGEFSQMSLSERKTLTEFVCSYVNGRVPVIIGTGSTSTRDVIQLNDHAKSAGADGVVIINPYYWPLTEEHLFQHYSEIAERSPLPIILYNFPALTGQELTPDFVCKLVDKHPNVVGIKETVDATGHIREMIYVMKKKHPHFSILCGYDDHLLPTLALGGDGAISATTNFAPELQMGIYNAILESNWKKAAELQKRFVPLLNMYKIDTPFVNVIKEAIRLRGLEIETHILPPARTLSEEKKAILKTLMEEAGLL